jgi:hypothetical protein
MGLRKLKYFLLVFILPALGLKAQTDTSFTLLKTIQRDIVNFTVDNLDNLYILDSRNHLSKFDANGDSVASFNDVKKFGQVTLVDVSNPLKVLLYYRDFATVVVLDRFLNVRNTIDLRKQNILQAKAIGQSYDNKVWVYDEQENKLKKIDENGKLLQETTDLRLLLNKSISPVKIFDEDKYVYLYDSTKGIYVFDYYGGLKNTIMLSGWKNLKVAGKYIFGSKSDTLYRYEIKTLRTNEWKLPEQLYKSHAFNFSGTHLYAFRKECNGNESCILIYSIR